MWRWPAGIYMPRGIGTVARRFGLWLGCLMAELPWFIWHAAGGAEPGVGRRGNVFPVWKFGRGEKGNNFPELLTLVLSLPSFLPFSEHIAGYRHLNDAENLVARLFYIIPFYFFSGIRAHRKFDCPPGRALDGRVRRVSAPAEMPQFIFRKAAATFIHMG